MIIVYLSSVWIIRVRTECSRVCCDYRRAGDCSYSWTWDQRSSPLIQIDACRMPRRPLANVALRIAYRAEGKLDTCDLLKGNFKLRPCSKQWSSWNPLAYPDDWHQLFAQIRRQFQTENRDSQHSVPVHLVWNVLQVLHYLFDSFWCISYVLATLVEIRLFESILEHNL